MLIVIIRRLFVYVRHETYGEVFKFQMFNRIIVVTSDKNTIKVNHFISAFKNKIFNYLMMSLNLLKEGLITKNYPKDKTLQDKITDPFGKR